METSGLFKTPASGGFVMVWAAILLICLFFLFLSGRRQVVSKKSGIWMGCLILLISAGQFLGFNLYHIPKVTSDLERENWELTDKIAALDLENVTRNDLILAYKTENEVLGDLIRDLRARSPGKAAERQGQNLPREGKPLLFKDGARCLPDSLSLIAGPQVAARDLPMASEDNASYAVTLITANPYLPLAQGVEALLRERNFTLKEPVPMYTMSNRIVFYSAADLRKAEEIVAVLNSKLDLSLGLKLSPDPDLKGNFQISISP